MKPREINTSDYCCCLTGHGHFYDAEELETYSTQIQRWSWLSNQGELTITGLEWSLFIGVSHNDEEWRQADDIREFLLEGVEYLEAFREVGRGRFSLSMSYSHQCTGFELSACTAGLLSALNIGLSIRLKMNPEAGGYVPNPGGDLLPLTGIPPI